MGRWRPPPEKSSPYITPQGAESLRHELADLWSLRRRDVVPALTAAAAEGDRSENAEYIYRKKQLGEIDRRIRYLSKRLDEIKVIDQPPARLDKVFFGALVTLESTDKVRQTYRIAGADEIDPEKGYISIDSPLARALLGSEVGGEFAIEIEQRVTRYTVLDIQYPEL